MAKRNGVTSKKVASEASYILDTADGLLLMIESFIKQSKSVAGSALTQTKPKRKGK